MTAETKATQFEPHADKRLSSPWRQRPRLNALVIEGSLELSKQLAALLSSFSCIEAIREARNEPEAWRAVDEASPGLVLLDIHLQGGRALRLLKKINEQQPKPLTVALTNSSSTQYRRKCKEAGADLVLDKALGRRRIRTLLQALLNESKAGGELFADKYPQENLIQAALGARSKESL